MVIRLFDKIYNKFFKRDIIEDKKNNLDKLNGLSLLLIADTHRRLSEKQLENLTLVRKNVDFIITLGDIPVESMSEIKPDYGVLGNHDYINGIEDVADLHMTIREIESSNIKLGGFQGSSRYKPGNFVMYSQEESIGLLNSLEYCDILITHDSCIKEYYKTHLDYIDAHSGLLGIDNYLEEKRSLLHIYGHHHKDIVEEKYNVPSICVYGMVILNIKDGRICLEKLD